jgi:hypothetical protein
MHALELMYVRPPLAYIFLCRRRLNDVRLHFILGMCTEAGGSAEIGGGSLPCSEGPRFRTRPGNRISCLRISVAFIISLPTLQAMPV